MLTGTKIGQLKEWNHQLVEYAKIFSADFLTLWLIMFVYNWYILWLGSNVSDSAWSAGIACVYRYAVPLWSVGHGLPPAGTGFTQCAKPPGAQCSPPGPSAARAGGAVQPYPFYHSGNKIISNSLNQEVSIKHIAHSLVDPFFVLCCIWVST